MQHSARGRGRPRIQTVPEFGLPTLGAYSSPRRSSSSDFADALPSILEPPISWEPEFEIDNKLRKKNFPPRPREQPGARYSGRTIRLVANCFEIALRSGTVYHYDVEVSPTDASSDVKEEKSEKKKYRALSNKINRRVMDRLFPVTKNGVFGDVLPAYDGKKNLFVRKRLLFGNSEAFRTTVEVDFEDEGLHGGVASRSFDVTFKFAAEVNIESLRDFYERRSSSAFPQSVVMALDIVFRHNPSLVFTPIGRSLFRRPTREELARDGHIGTKDVWSGYYQSVRPGENAPVLNIDRAKTMFYSPLNLISFVEAALDVSVERKKFLSESEVFKLSKELKGIQVYSTHLGLRKKYRILRLLREKPGEIEFTIKRDDEEFKTDVKSYFKRQYDIELRHPNLPCVQMYPESKFVCLPLELCEIVEGQHYRRRLGEDDLRAFVKLTAVKPVQRFNEIVRCADTHVRCAEPWLDEFGVRNVNLRPMEFNARIIDAPNLRYEREDMPGVVFDETRPFFGSWNVDGKRFLDGAAIDNRWVVIYFDRRLGYGGTIRNFATLVVEEGTKRGMVIDMPVQYMHVHVEWGDPMESLQRAFRETKEKYGAVLAVIVLERKDGWYREVKRAGDVLVGLTTQCVVQDNIGFRNEKRTRSVVSNIVQKLNAKLGGRNHSFVPKEFPAGRNLLRETTLIMGVDVTHPPPHNSSFPSIAAAVGSVDDAFTRYVSTVKIQESEGKIESRVEVIKELKDMVKKLMVEFEKVKRCKPEKIILYRDGVSEGQFKEVRDFEISAIWNACLELGGSHYKPKITFVVAQRRHHFRFRPKNFEDGVGACKNVPPGTIVDSHITHPRDFDFFLCSHVGIQGTSRPTHYYVLWDDNMFPSEWLQQLTYDLCHVSQRCTRAISVPAPVFYADLVATRAHNHLSSALCVEDVSGSSISGSSMQMLSEEMKKSILLHEDLRTSMNFI